jgi:hypothetical protein
MVNLPWPKLSIVIFKTFSFCALARTAKLFSFLATTFLWIYIFNHINMRCAQKWSGVYNLIMFSIHKCLPFLHNFNLINKPINKQKQWKWQPCIPSYILGLQSMSFPFSFIFLVQINWISFQNDPMEMPPQIGLKGFWILI